ncbi:MAG: ribosome rescue protein RqcH [Candidatus Bathyarchaeota archaeon]|nr:ribosome rescue protein RqcH [Candidatus Bathyarchaeota archaeon]
MRKKDFTSFDIAAAVKEFQSTVADSRVNNIYQFTEKTLVFKLHKTDKAPLRLAIEAGKRIHQTAYAEESPAEPPPFCMMLRKYLRDSWFRGIEQYGFERIVTLSFETKTGMLRLVVELFGDGNFILINEQNVIVQALAFKKMRDRDILRGLTLEYPPQSGINPFQATLEVLKEGLNAAGEVEAVRFLARFLGVGGVYAEEILLRAGVEKSRPCISLKPEETDAVFGALQSLLAPVMEGKFEPGIIQDSEGSYLDVTPLKLRRYEGYRTQPFESFNAALDEFYLHVTAVERAAGTIEVDKLKAEAARLKRMVAEQEKSIAEDEAKSEHDRQIGDVIYAHFNELESFQETLLKASSQGYAWEAIVGQVLAAKKQGKLPMAYVESFDGKNMAFNMNLEGLRLSFCLRLSLFDNANEYYERGKRAKQKAQGAMAALYDSRRKLGEAEAELLEAERLRSLKPAEIMEALSKRKEEMETRQWYEKFRHFTSSDGFLVVAGKDTVSNEVLIKKHTSAEDVVFHAEIAGSPFVVVKAEGREVSGQALLEAAEAAASYSRAWREGAGAADVYWVRVDQLSKSGPSGESVPHGAFFVVGKRNWFRNTPLRVAVGICVGEEAAFVGGPVDSVRAKTKTYVVIQPGDYQGKELLQLVLRALTAKLSREQRIKAGKTSIEQIREYIPYTKGALNPKATTP